MIYQKINSIWLAIKNMRLANLFKDGVWILIVNRIGIPVFLIYLFFMVVYPFFANLRNLEELQKIWENWQTLNAGFLALISSIVAFNISLFNEEQQRKRRFVAARAFLPDAYSELSEYYRVSSRLIYDAWSHLSEINRLQNRTMQVEVPHLPVNYKETFRQCINSAEAHVSDDLVKILVKMQVHHSRMKDLVSTLSSQNGTALMRRNLLAYFFQLGALQAGINKNFEFARGEAVFDESPLTWDDYRNAYSNLNIHLFNIVGLEEFTKNKLLQSSGANI